MLTWKELDDRCDALANGLQSEAGMPKTIAIMCRNHRGFVEALVASIGQYRDVHLVNVTPYGHVEVQSSLNRPAKVIERESALELGGMDDGHLQGVRVQVRCLAVQQHGVHAVESLHTPPHSRSTVLSNHRASGGQALSANGLLGDGVQGGACFEIAERRQIRRIDQARQAAPLQLTEEGGVKLRKT